MISQAQQKFALELQNLQAQYAAYVAYWNKLKAEYEGDLWDNENENVKAVYGGYVSAQSLVNSLTEARMKQQVQKAQAEAQIVTAEEAMNQQLADWNTQKAQLTRNLAKLQAMKEAQPSKDEYLQKLDELETQAYDILNNAGREALADKVTKKNAYTDAKDAVEKGDTYAVVAALGTLDDMVRDYGNKSYGTDYYSVRNFATKSSIPVAEDEQDAFQKEWGVCPEGDFNIYAYELVATTIEAAKLQMDAAFEGALAEADDDIEAAIGKAWETDDDGNILYGSESTSVNGVKGYIDYYNQQIDAEKKNIADNETRLAAAKLDNDAALIASLEAAIKTSNNNIDTYEGYIKDAAVTAQDAQANLNDANEDKAEIVADQKAYQEAVAALAKAENQKAYQDAIAALETPAVAYIEAQSTSKEYEDQLADLGFDVTTNGTVVPSTTVQGTYQLIKNELDGINDVQSQIDACNTQLAQIEAALQQASVLGTLVTTSTYYVGYTDPITGEYKSISVKYFVLTTSTGVTTEDAIALIDANIAMLDAQIEVQQALANKYKAQLDAYLNTGEEPTPETPSEETPSEEQPAEETPAA